MNELFNKKYLIPVYSGTLAIESILKLLNLNKDDKVLISSTVCYSILEAILNSNLKPVIAIPKKGVTLSEEELKNILKQEDIKVFMAVHQYGYEQVIPKLKDIIVIEDISQSWNLIPSKYPIGKNSDYIITSLGKTKPLSNGIGGLIITDNDILKYFDYKKKECRLINHHLLEYYYDKPINYEKIINKANKKVAKQRKQALLLDKIFTNNKYIHKLSSTSIPSYHRYLVTADKKLEEFLTILNDCNIKYQKEYKIKLYEIPLIAKYNIKVIGNTKNNYILIELNNLKNIKLLQKRMEELKWIIN